MANTWQSVVLAGALLGATTSVFAQATASIAGEIVDAASRKPITSAQVTLRGTALRAVTDLSGSFTIRSVPPGQHAVDVRKIGYEPLARDSIMVSSGEVVRLSLTMTPAAFRLAEVTVTPGSFSSSESKIRVVPFVLVRDPEAWFTILPSLGVSWSKRF